MLRWDPNAATLRQKVKLFRDLGDETRLTMVRMLREAGGEMAAADWWKGVEPAGLHPDWSSI